MSLRRIVALLLSLTLVAGLGIAPADGAEVEVTWLPQGVCFPTYEDIYYIPQLGWLDVALEPQITAEEWIQERRVYDLNTGTFVEGIDIVYPFSEGLAHVEKDGKHGFIDETGEIVIPMTWDAAWPFFGGVTVVQKKIKTYESGYCVVDGYETYIIDTTGQIVRRLDCKRVEGFSQGVIRVRKKGYGAYAFMDTAGNWLTDEDYYGWAEDFAEGLGMVEKDGKYGFINAQGEMVIPLELDFYHEFAYHGFSEGLMVLCRRDGDDEDTERYGYMDAAGQEVISAEYLFAHPFSEGLAVVDLLEEGAAVIDKTGTVQFLFCWERYDACGITFHNGLLLAVREEKYGALDRTGREVVPCRYDDMGMVWEDAGATSGRYHYVMEGDRAGLLTWEMPAQTDGIAYSSAQSGAVDGVPVTFLCYALKDEQGNDTNYIRLRDVADVLNGSAAQFQVDWDGSIAITTNAAYTPNGTEMVQNFAGNQSYTISTSPVTVNGVATNLEAITLTDASGGGYTYFKLRDLGAALGFNVGWSADRGVYIETDQPYNANN